MTPKQWNRFIIGMIPVIIAGILLAVTRAPLWAGIVTLVILCFTVLPWVMLADVWHLRNDRFRLDPHREVLVDGKPHVITGYSVDGNMRDHTYINVTLEPTQEWINRNINHDIGAP